LILYGEDSTKPQPSHRRAEAKLKSRVVSDMEASATLVGQVGFVSLAIPAGKPGEVILPVRGGTEAFAAWSDEPISKHTRVVVVEDRSGRSVTVSPL
jgi:hypothetical protein